MSDLSTSLTVRVSGIPNALGVADVRAFFGDLIEASCFAYFHFLPSNDSHAAPRDCYARMKGQRELKRLIEACHGSKEPHGEYILV